MTFRQFQVSITGHVGITDRLSTEIELVGPGPKPKTHKPKPAHNIIDPIKSLQIFCKSLQNLCLRNLLKISTNLTKSLYNLYKRFYVSKDETTQSIKMLPDFIYILHTHTELYPQRNQIHRHITLLSPFVCILIYTHTNPQYTHYSHTLSTSILQTQKQHPHHPQHPPALDQLVKPTGANTGTDAGDFLLQ
ncbi:hypothetical protein HanXRQr2_Chr03g0094581 [Helianthus annuus]|uniref:Uncharacterized protein n=1 Tax=Helianthus annuus TaxID=4232 RepID=A0A9K3NV62_HELAN|nr:hypothetical protein HanXRQr2_Chr03g0094581 [Helianthus annuus]KAJ0591932.1 hypothetical protein HanHA300_Chr03g0079031 [Helianthus annuus]KAJ0606904.1 hypothetical protein HanHA89_Chr03g0090391 [Helianthus annuus]KAJ0766970.1 hypothetical protein HanLR1_Chr03g0083711 [Helianthus annuus]